MKHQKEVIAVRLRPTTKKRLIQLAEQKEMSTSELARQIVENYMNLL